MNNLFFPIIATAFVSLAAQMSYIWTSDVRQQRPQMIEHPSLVAAAQWKAEYISQTGHFAHRTAEGEYPNETAERFGCDVPYDTKRNDIESLVKGTDHAPIAYEALINSPSHREHLLAEVEHFQKQIYFGVGHSNLVFVFLSAECLSDSPSP